MVPEGVGEKWREMRWKVKESSGGGAEGERGKIEVGGLAGEEKRVEAYGVVEGDLGVVGYDHGVKEAERDNQSENASE
jgi:hypothetical protein